MNLILLDQEFSICRLEPGEVIPEWYAASSFGSITQTQDETSIICPSDHVPDSVESEPGWRGLEVEGPLAFEQVGVLAELITPLAAAQVPVFVVATYLTDYLFIQLGQLNKALQVLSAAGHRIIKPN